MVNIAACATRGLKLPSRKQTRNEIKRMFKEQMKAFKERLNVSSPLVSFPLSYLLLSLRARLSAVQLVSPVMPGRHQMQTHILLWQVIGSKRYSLMSGSNRRHFSVSLRWTPLTIGIAWVRHYIKSVHGLELFIRFVIVPIYHLHNLWHNFYYYI